ncbi:MAG: hypothetical protein GQ581_09535 [Methyloprofundus sp.]|nr:hypothetical protein [Methyloprofundus sp.]
MLIPKLFKKQQIYLPTPLGLTLITLIFLITTIFILKNLAHYLTQQQSIQAEILIVEGWISEQGLNEVIQHYKANPYKILITTGGLIKGKYKIKHKTYAESAAAYLRKNGLNKIQIKSLPAPDSAQNRTFLSAVIVRDWMQQQKTPKTKINIISQGVHARRTKFLYQIAFGEQYQIGIIAAKPVGYQLANWWQSSIGAKAVLTELIGLTWVKCCFYPGEYQSHQERWGIKKKNIKGRKLKNDNLTQTQIYIYKN